MNYNWDNFGKFAEYIEKIPDNEIDEETRVRNIISRMCYHAFHCLEIWAIEKAGYKCNMNSSTHQSLINCLRRTKIRDRANDYTQLKAIRVACDYKHESLDVKNQLQDAKFYYKNIVNMLSGYSQLK